ncbi:MAG: aldehyde dehydrogenase family protein [Anaerolineales bacterium]|nr:aldehyde dehydrogenase family protein [Anaerolineales bacterium]
MPKTSTRPAKPGAKNGKNGKPPARAAKKAAAKAQPFKLTYATMFSPPESMHTKYDQALAAVKANMGRDYGMLINNQDVFHEVKFDDRSPINTEWLLGTFQKGTRAHVDQAISAAAAAGPQWAGLTWQNRVRLLRRGAQQIEKRVYEIGAVLSLEVGKNRMEGLGDAQETADMIYYACDQVEANGGYVKEMGRDPLAGFGVTNYSHLRPYGVWVVISPFNFPMALAGGPSGAALVAGNTVVFKPATDTPLTGRLLAECLRDGGLPDGVFNFVTGGGSEVGQALIDDPRVAGITFTGSYDVGMRIYRAFAAGRYPRPCIAEMGGKNPAIVSRHANLEDAATGIIRSAFGLQGQKCSANSRIIVEAPVKEKLTQMLADRTAKLTLGDPTRRENWLGPVVNAGAYREFSEFSEELSQAGQILHGGKQRTDGDFGKGYFCEPTLVDGVDKNHRLWKHEMFLPITMVTAVDSLDEAMRMANAVDYGLTAGFYGNKQETEWFFDHIEAGVTYSNRPQGSTTGAWPGFQPFGGWKGSGSTGKNAGGLYYVPLYAHEQIRTRVTRAK